MARVGCSSEVLADGRVRTGLARRPGIDMSVDAANRSVHATNHASAVFHDM